MSALPYGSAAPFAPAYAGSAAPYQPYGGGSAVPYQAYGAAQYSQSFQPYQTYSAPMYQPEQSTPMAATQSTSIPDSAPAIAQLSINVDYVEKEKKTVLEIELDKVLKMEDEIEAAIHDIEMKHVDIHQNHSAYYNKLFQRENHALTVQTQNVARAYDDIPEEYLNGRWGVPPLKETKPVTQYPPAGSSMITSPNTSVSTNLDKPSTEVRSHPMDKLGEVQVKIISLRKHLEKLVQKEPK